MTISCCKRFEFDAGHRVLGHKGQCRHLHGHRYAVEVTVSSPDLDGLGMVADFGFIKARVGGWIDAYLDHNMILHRYDPLAKLFLAADPDEASRPDSLFAGKRPYLMNDNPTAENIAREIYRIAVGMLPDPLAVESVRVYETPTCWAEYRKE
jgi:6-pyruvoyltetrahydropterin/6-carboxytetrahydropterin synthase